jgi:hypothetical protein
MIDAFLSVVIMCTRCGFCCIWFQVKEHQNLKDKPCPHLRMENHISYCLIYDDSTRYQGCSAFDCQDDEFRDLFSRWTDFYERRAEWELNRAKQN